LFQQKQTLDFDRILEKRRIGTEGSVNAALEEYAQKRDFEKTGEPLGTVAENAGNIFVVQEHRARRLHHDFRLAREGVLKSWAVPKGIPEKLGIKRLAVQTEDHPLEYGRFEGVIPKGQYGAGTVRIWDRGFYELKTWADDKIEVLLKGERLRGMYVLVRLKKLTGKPRKQSEWLLIKLNGLNAGSDTSNIDDEDV
jgi:DNA ligase D-like protein (predicted 3'-phosphoesterase)